MQRFANKAALITGGGGDIGRATAERLLAEGAQVMLTDYAAAELADAAQALAGAYPGRVQTIQGDVRQLADCEKAVAATLAAFGKIDVLVATAGILRHHPLDELTEADWQDVIDINLTGVYHSVRAAVAPMKAQNCGRMVLISSVGGRTGRPGVGVNYAAAKAGVVGMTMLLGYELAPWHITVNCVAPGPLKGRMFESMKPEDIKRLESTVRLGRVGTMAEIAAAIAYLASDEAAWTTGEVLDVNGGAQF